MTPTTPDLAPDVNFDPDRLRSGWRARQNSQFLRFLKFSQVAEAAGAAAFAAALAVKTGWSSPGAWLIWMLCALAVRGGALALPERVAGRPVRLWAAGGINALCGCVWGAGALVLASGSDGDLLLLTIMWLTGVAAAGLAMAASTSLAPLAHALPIIACSFALLLQTQDPALRMLTVGLFVLYAFLAVVVFAARRTMESDFELQLTNAELLARIERAQAHTEQLNEDLRNEIERRRAVEAGLIADRDQAERLSAIDGLTGIRNRRAFDEALAKETGRARRASRPLSLIIADVDFFKPFNDAHGHLAGDEVLRQVATLLDSATRRSTDLACRYGGEEFAVLLPDTEIEDAETIAEQIRAAVERLAIPHAASEAAPVLTLSLGVASVLPTDDGSAGRLVATADNALYQAKRSGRNRVTLAAGDTRLRRPQEEPGEDPAADAN